MRRSDPPRPGSDVIVLVSNFNLLSTDSVSTGHIHSQFLIHFCICSVVSSFKEFRQTLLYYDVDLITCTSCFLHEMQILLVILYDCFDLDNMNDNKCKAKFRVRKRDLPTLA